MRAYMVHGGEPEEGASLVFANSAREAKRMGYYALTGFGLVDWYIDVRVKWLREGAEIHREKDEPHVIEAPASCWDCGLWYPTWKPEGEDTTCPDCKDLEAMYEV